MTETSRIDEFISEETDQSADMRNRRKSVRIPIKGAVFIKHRSEQEDDEKAAMPAISCTLKNVSVGGLALESQKRIPESSIVHIWSSSQNINQAVPVTAEVKWCLLSSHIGGYMLGVQFENPEEVGEDFLQDLMGSRDLSELHAPL